MKGTAKQFTCDRTMFSDTEEKVEVILVISSEAETYIEDTHAGFFFSLFLDRIQGGLQAV